MSHGNRLVLDWIRNQLYIPFLTYSGLYLVEKQRPIKPFAQWGPTARSGGVPGGGIRISKTTRGGIRDMILAISFLSGLSTPLGALVVLWFRTMRPWMLSFILALASGVMVTVVATELAPTSVGTGGFPTFVLGCGGGIVAMSFLADIWKPGDTAVSRLRRTGQSIALAIAVHDLPEGMAIGAGHAVHAKLGLIVALAIALHNMPEGMSIAAPLAMSGVARRKVLGLTVLISFITPLGTLIPVMLGTVSHTVGAFILAFAAGAMLYVVVQDTFPESWHASRGAAIVGLLAGAALMGGLASL